MRMRLYIINCLLACMLLAGCAGSTRLSQSGLASFFEGDTFTDHFVGFQLFDPEVDRILYSHQAAKLFTPASNTKILTLYTATQNLGDSLLSFRYKNQDDTLFVWPMGDPTSLHPYFGDQKKALDFLKAQPKPITFCLNHINVERFGPGWAWDDYPYYYQAERSFFPLYGNVVWFELNERSDLVSYFPNDFSLDIQLGQELILKRTENQNLFQVGIPDLLETNASFGVPFVANQAKIGELISRHTGKKPAFSDSCPAMETLTDFYSIPVDTVYSLFMKKSDNFIAEQLLLMSAGSKLNVLDSRKIIEETLSGGLSTVSDELKWVDGSGLSRYNLASPGAIVHVLTKLLDNLGFDKIKKVFPAGGKSGTILNWYGSESGEPYVYAKTGTLSNIHCLSGYIICNSGKILVFSFMHSNFSGPSANIKSKMAEVLRLINQEY